MDNDKDICVRVDTLMKAHNNSSNLRFRFEYLALDISFIDNSEIQSDTNKLSELQKPGAVDRCIAKANIIFQ